MCCAIGTVFFPELLTAMFRHYRKQPSSFQGFLLKFGKSLKNEHSSAVVSTPSYSVEPGFECRSRPSFQSAFVVFLSPSRQMLVHYLETDLDCFDGLQTRPNVIHNHSVLTRPVHCVGK